MDHQTMHLIRTIFGIIGNIISFGLFLVPVPKIWRIFTNKSVEELIHDPFTAVIFNCCLWIFYGTVHPDSTLVWTINSIGLVLYTIYISIFVIYAPTKQKVDVLIVMLLVAIVMVAVAVSNLLLVRTIKNRSLIVGALCVVYNIFLYGSILTSIVEKVFKTKSVEFLSFWKGFCGLLNCICWTIYSLLPVDLNLLIVNGLGILSSMFVFGLIWYFGGEKKEEEEQVTKSKEKQMTKFEVEIANIVKILQYYSIFVPKEFDIEYYNEV